MFEQKNLKLFNEIYNDTYDFLLKYVICKCSSIDDVNDIIQDTYLELYNKLKQNTLINDYNKYLIGICKNVIRKHYRFKYRQKEVQVNLDDKYLNNIKDEANLELDFIKQEELDIVYNYLRGKKLIVFKVFYLFYHDEVSIKEISSLLNISVSKTKNILYRTLNELRNVLKKELI